MYFLTATSRNMVGLFVSELTISPDIATNDPETVTAVDLTSSRICDKAQCLRFLTGLLLTSPSIVVGDDGGPADH